MKIIELIREWNSLGSPSKAIICALVATFLMSLIILTQAIFLVPFVVTIGFAGLIYALNADIY